MKEITRRDFLKVLGAASALITFSGRGASLVSIGDDARPFEFLVIGDSLIWGQGLNEKDKFYSLTADWLRNELFAGRRTVNLKVKAHSGATLKFHPDEAEKYRKAQCPENFFHPPEVTLGFPSIWKQLDDAADEYRSAGDANGADLIMLTGGITDISVAKVLDPRGDDSKLRPLIVKYCRDDMFDVLAHAAELNPNATIAVVGYFPMLSPKTPGSRLFNSWLESMRFPHFLKPIANNPVTRKLFFNKMRKSGIRRSRIWFEESNRNLQIAVERFNATSKGAKSIFIRSPLTEDNSLETPNTLLFRMKGSKVEDPLFETRVAQCDTTLTELKRTTGIDYPVRTCEIAGVGHPDPAGAAAYAEAIKKSLGSDIIFLKRSRSI